MNHSYIVAFWSPFDIPSRAFYIDFFSRALKKHGNIQCLSCKDIPDERTMRLMRRADLIVIVLRQDYRELCRLFCEITAHFANYIYMITDYVPSAELGLERISFIFRIPRCRITCIPYIPLSREEHADAEPRGYSLAAAKKYCPRNGMDFKKELKRSLNVILKALGF